MEEKGMKRWKRERGSRQSDFIADESYTKILHSRFGKERCKVEKMRVRRKEKKVGFKR